MSKLVTLTSLRQRVRDRGEWRSSYITDAMLNAWLNEAQFKFVSMMAEVDPQRYLKSQLYDLAVGNQEIDLPADFWKAHSVAFSADTEGIEGYHVLDRFDWTERWNNVSESGVESISRRSLRWTVRGKGDSSDIYDGYYVLLFDRPAAYQGIVIVDYFPAVSDLEADDDVFDVINGVGLEWVLSDACVKASAKEEDDPAVWIDQRDRAEKLLLSGIGRLMSDTGSSVPASDSSQLIDMMRAVRARGPWDRDAFKDTDLIEWINSSLGSLYDIVIASDESHFLETAYQAVSAGVRTYATPAGFYKMLQVSVEQADVGDGYAVIEPFRWEEFYDAGDETNANAARWAVRGNLVHLQPQPGWEGVMRFDYIALPGRLTDPSDSIYFQSNLWQEYVVCDACIKASLAAGTDPQQYIAQRDAQAARITQSAEIDISQRKTSDGTTTLIELIRQLRTRGPWPRASFSDAQAKEWLNASQAALLDLIIPIDPTSLQATAYTEVTPYLNVYDTPSDMYRMIQVSADDGDGYAVLETFRWEEIFERSDASTAAAARWNFREAAVYLQPTPEWAGILRFDYIKTPMPMSNYDDSLEPTLQENSWQEWIILDACVKAAIAAGVDPAPWAQQRQETAERIRSVSARILEEKKTSTEASSLAGLIRSVRTRGQWPREALSDTQIKEWLNTSQAAFQDLLFEYDPTQFLSRHDISVVSGTREYDLPTDFYRLIGVAVGDSSNPNGYAVLERINWDERYDYVTITDKTAARYLIQGDLLILHPTPTWSGTIRLEYMPHVAGMADYSDTLTLTRNAWQEWIVLDACIKAAMTMGTDPQQYLAQRAEQERRIMRASPRDAGKPKTVTDVYRRRYDSDRRYGAWRRRW